MRALFINVEKSKRWKVKSPFLHNKFQHILSKNNLISWLRHFMQSLWPLSTSHSKMNSSIKESFVVQKKIKESFGQNNEWIGWCISWNIISTIITKKLWDDITKLRKIRNISFSFHPIYLFIYNYYAIKAKSVIFIDTS